MMDQDVGVGLKQVVLCFERKAFEFDRRIVTMQLEVLCLVLAGGVMELEMAAAEHIFEPMIARRLQRKARSLRRLERALKRLREAVTTAAPYGPERGPVPRLRVLVVKNTGGKRGGMKEALESPPLSASH